MKKQTIFKIFLGLVFTSSLISQIVIAESEPMDIRDYVRQYFVEGVPYAETISQYDETVVPILLEMLNDPKEEDFFKINIVAVLGMVGDESILEPLIEFIEEPTDKEPSDPAYIAKTSAIVSMGYFINRTDNEEALTYLADSLQPEVWIERGIAEEPSILPATSPDEETTRGLESLTSTDEDSTESLEALIEVRNFDYSQKAILGLALSGNESALEALQSARPSPLEATPSRFEAAVRENGLLEEAISAHAQIATEGLEGYYNEDQ